MKTRELAEDAELYNHPLSRQVIGCAIEVHWYLGPGLLENAYEKCLAHEMHLAEAPIGLIINFNVKLLKDGIKKCAISDFSALSCVNS